MSKVLLEWSSKLGTWEFRLQEWVVKAVNCVFFIGWLIRAPNPAFSSVLKESAVPGEHRQHDDHHHLLGQRREPQWSLRRMLSSSSYGCRPFNCGIYSSLLCDSILLTSADHENPLSLLPSCFLVVLSFRRTRPGSHPTMEPTASAALTTTAAECGLLQVLRFYPSFIHSVA